MRYPTAAARLKAEANLEGFDPQDLQSAYRIPEGDGGAEEQIGLTANLTRTNEEAVEIDTVR